MENNNSAELLGKVTAYYNQKLKESPPALDYLKQRGLVHPEVIDRFQIGYSDNSLHKILPAAKTQKGKEIRNRLKELGVTDKTGKDVFKGCLTFPICNEYGEIVEIYGRRAKEVIPQLAHLFLNGGKSGFLNLEALESKDLILCGSVVDALSFWIHGFLNTLVSFPTGEITDEFKKLLERYRVKSFTFAYPNDDENNKTVEKLAKELRELEIKLYKVKFPLGHSANEFMLLHDKPTLQRKAFEKILDQAQWIKAGNNNRTAKEGVESLQTLTPSMAANASSKKIAKTESENMPDSVKKKESSCEIKEDEVLFQFDDREYKIKGLFKNLSLEVMKINIRVFRGELYYIDSLDLYQAKPRNHFVKVAADELNVDKSIIKADMGKILMELENLIYKEIEKEMGPVEIEIMLTPEEEVEALELLKSENLLDQIADDLETCGLIGERENSLLAYLAMTSRKMEKPLAVIVQSSSSAGKSTLMDAVLEFLPEEDLIRYTAMTGQSLFYIGENNLVHKTLAISEEEGAERAAYAIKTLQSEGCLRIASTGKNPKTGRMETQSYKVNGPAQVFLTTTNIDLDPELENRCLILTVNESRKQTEAIQTMQRENDTLEGLKLNQQRFRLRYKHQNAQRLIQPIQVINPFSRELTFPSHRLRLRRDHDKYLTLIKSIALLFQHQREIKVLKDGNGDEELHYIEVVESDIKVANRLFPKVLERSLEELPPQTILLLNQITQLCKEKSEMENIPLNEVRFIRRDLKRYTTFGETQTKVHLARLVSHEYLLSYRKHVNEVYQYELLYYAEQEKQTAKDAGIGCINPLLKQAV
ncbi:toprim domain-containing protein [bacterium]|nr:toprim domain-containing protein [bacterium]